MIDIFTVAVKPMRGSAPRRVYVYVPPRARLEPDARFPVLYMFDGHNVFFDSHAAFGKSWGMGDYLDKTGTELIVAAVECDHRPPFARLSEYSPFSFTEPQFGHVSGKGKPFMDWLTGTFKPMIDGRYPTLPDRAHTFIAGSSMGGLMSLYAVAAYNHVFSRAAALSPSVWLVRRPMMSLIRKADIAAGTVAYMDYGAREMENHPDMLSCFLSVAGALAERGVAVTSRVVPGGDHCEACWQEQIPFFMNVLFYNRE